MVNYNNSIIYKLCCKDPEITEIYVGSTTNFYRRKQKHKSTCNNSNDKGYNLNIYQFIRDNGGWENWQMVEVERYKCN
jgi:predicted GIY-YIG superfamily endonuclease